MRWILILTLPVAVGCETHPDVEFLEPTPTPVDRAPSAPRLVSAEGRPSAADIAWLPNAADEEVVSYTIMGASTEWTSWNSGLPDALSVTTAGCCAITIGDLDDEKSYWFGLLATNSVGAGETTPPQRVLPPGWKGSQTLSTTSFDIAEGVAVAPSGDVFVIGWTDGDLGGEINEGQGDVFVARFLADGTLVWTRMFGTNQYDSGFGIDVTSLGEPLIVGYTSGTLPGNSSSGGADVFVMLLSPADGDPVWIRQFGSSLADNGQAVKTFGEYAYVVGVAGDDLGGQTNQGDNDAFLMKIKLSDGIAEWTRLIGTTAADNGYDVAVAPDGSAVFVCGSTSGNLDGGGILGAGDAFVRRFSSSGSAGWVDQFGTAAADTCSGVAASSSSIYATGSTGGALDGQSNLGTDIYLREMAADVGTYVATVLIGGPGTDAGVSASMSSGGVVVFGSG